MKVQKLKLNDFDYHLPKELIAQKPMKPRDYSRLLVLHKSSGKIEHKFFYNLIDYLMPGDLLVLNNSKVFPARLLGKKIPGGGKIEIFLLEKITEKHKYFQGRKNNLWTCLVGGRKAEHQRIDFGSGLTCELAGRQPDGTFVADFDVSGKKFNELVNVIGQVPLPPYIKRKDGRPKKSDLADYQTIYADSRKTGSVAAPTAGLHFTGKLMRGLKAKGIEIEYVTLQVGLGTFSSVKEEDIKRHKMHSEWVEVKKEVMEKTAKVKKEGRRVITVGTTSTRALEAAFNQLIAFSAGKRNTSYELPVKKNMIKDFVGWVDIFIYPGYKFRVVDGLVTNFHLPKSTLLMLISALAGKEKIDKSYHEAMLKKYRFYSYGDAMLII